MPSTNTVKSFDSHAYYHVYNCGAGGQNIFLDFDDRRKFLEVLRRHLTKQGGTENYPKYAA